MQLQFDPITTGLLINTFSFELFGNTAAEIPTVTVTLGGAAYKLTKITYTGVRTQYYIELGQDQALFNYIDGIRGVLSYMKLVKNAGVTLPDYYIVTNGVKEQVAKIHF